MPNISVTLEYEDGSYKETSLPAKNEVCPWCEGNGTQDAWDNGMTAAEMAEQGPDFAEDYASGMYDVRCSECDGRRVVLVVDRYRCDSAALSAYDRAEESRLRYEAEVAAERRYFSG